jgi:hypothetical protein
MSCLRGRVRVDRHHGSSSGALAHGVGRAWISNQNSHKHVATMRRSMYGPSVVATAGVTCVAIRTALVLRRTTLRSSRAKHKPGRWPRGANGELHWKPGTARGRGGRSSGALDGVARLMGLRPSLGRCPIVECG